MKIADLFSGVLVICAIIVTAIVVRREFMTAAVGVEIREVADWERVANQGRRLGTLEARLVVVEFSDFQCPYCEAAAQQIRELLEEYPSRLAVVYRHFPIESIHPHASLAAEAVECAGDLGQFERYHDALFDGQPSIGTRPWVEFITWPSPTDSAMFSECMEVGRHRERVAADKALGDSIGVSGTPTFIVDGRLHAGVDGVSAIRKLVGSSPLDAQR